MLAPTTLRRVAPALAGSVLFAALSVACSGSPGAGEGDEGSATDEAPVVAPHVYGAPPQPTESFPAPSTNAIWVAPTGNDTSGNGSSTAPYRTIAKAVAVANAKPAGPTWSVVLKAGTYREGQIVITRDAVTIQRNGTDAVSILGTQPVTGFTGSGPYSAIVVGVDTARLTVTCADAHLDQGASRPYGADQALGVTRGRVPLRRVAPGTTPRTGEYAFDPATKKLTIGDAPGGAPIEIVSALWAFQTRASNVHFEGLDVEGYGTCAVDYRSVVNNVAYYSGALQIFKDSPAVSGAVVDGCTIANNSAGGLQVAQSQDVTVKSSALFNNGWDGGLVATSDPFVLLNDVVSYNNMRIWQNSVEAGIKATHMQDGVIFGNLFEHNAANGFWCDQACGPTDLSKNWFVIAQNVFRYNDNKGLFYEVSHHAMIASNVAHDNGGPGIAAYGSRGVQIWNNTLVDNDSLTASYTANLSIVDDPRCAQGDVLPGGMTCSSSTPGVVPEPLSEYDHCVPSSSGALANTCNSESIVVANNIIVGSGGSRPVVNVTVPAKTYSAALTVTQSQYQAFWRPSTTAPSTLIEWQKDAAGSPIGYGSLSAFQAAIAGRETSSVERLGGSAPSFFVDFAGKDFTQSTSSTDVWGRGAPLPLAALKAVYWPSASPSQPSARIGAIAWAGKTTAPPPPPPPPACAYASPVYHVRNPANHAELYTLSATEATAASANGYTENDGVAWAAAATAAAAPGSVPVYRVYDPTSHDRLYTTSAGEKSSAMSNYGYTIDEGVAFYVAPSTTTCVVGVHRVRKTAIHSYTASPSEYSALIGAGWIDEGIPFFAAGP